MGVGGALVRVVAAGGGLCNRVRGAIYVNGGIVFVKKVNHASPCEGHEDIFWGKGKLPQVLDDIEDAMSNGSGNGGGNNEGRAEGGSLIPQVLREVLLVGNGLGNEDEVEVEGWVRVTGVNEVRNVLVAHEEPPDVIDGGGEGIGLEVGGRHDKGGEKLVG